MNNIEKTIIATTLMNTLFMNYKPNELNSSGELVRKRVAKYMRFRGRANRKLYMSTVKRVDKAWKQAVNHFADQNMKIEAKTVVSNIYNYIPNEMEKYVGITHEHIEKFNIISVDDCEAEKNSNEVVDFLMESLGFEKKKSLFAGKKLTIKNNLIVENKKIAVGF